MTLVSGDIAQTTTIVYEVEMLTAAPYDGLLNIYDNACSEVGTVTLTQSDDNSSYNDISRISDWFTYDLTTMTFSISQAYDNDFHLAEFWIKQETVFADYT